MGITRFESDDFPFVFIRLVVEERVLTLNALVDTGLDGDIVIPSAILADLDAPSALHSWRLVDGSVVEAVVYAGTVQLGNLEPIPADIAVLGEEPIIGRGIIDNYRVTFDHGERVIVEL